MKTQCVSCLNDLELQFFSDGDNMCDQCKKMAARKSSPAKYLLSIGVGKRHSVCSFENYKGNDADRLKEIITEDFGENVLIQSANVGNGKTHIAVASMLRFGILNCSINRFVNFSNLMLEIKSTFNRETLEGESEIIKKYCAYEMLVIDDIGAEKASDYNMSILYIILNNRYEASKPTIITTNMSGEEIVSQYGKRILSRLRSGYLVTLNTKDKRGLK